MKEQNNPDSEHQLTSHIKFPFQFDEKKLVHDLSLVLEHKWKHHFNHDNYSGEWKAIPLYSAGGDENNIYVVSPDSSEIKATAILNDCLYLKEVHDFFKFPILSSRILKLGIGAKINPHTDHELGYEHNNFRLHIPITTNDDIDFIVDGNKLKMLPGECWYTNVSLVHSVSNLGNSDRVHLVIDGERNAWSDDLFFSMADSKSFILPTTVNNSKETIQRTIQELKTNNQSLHQELIDELQGKLDKMG